MNRELAAWDLQLEEAQQTNLIITPSGEPEITVDKLEVVQFIYLLLNNPRIREVIDTITSKVVLILGRFTPGAQSGSSCHPREASQQELFACCL